MPPRLHLQHGAHFSDVSYHDMLRTSYELKIAGICAVNLRGITLRGSMRFVPFSSERLLLFSFVDKPELDVKLNIRGRFIGQQSIPQFAFLREAVIASLQRDYVVPNYGCVPLEFAPNAVRFLPRLRQLFWHAFLKWCACLCALDRSNKLRPSRGCRKLS